MTAPPLDPLPADTRPPLRLGERVAMVFGEGPPAYWPVADPDMPAPWRPNNPPSMSGRHRKPDIDAGPRPLAPWLRRTLSALIFAALVVAVLVGDGGAAQAAMALVFLPHSRDQWHEFWCRWGDRLDVAREWAWAFTLAALVLVAAVFFAYDITGGA